jgi:ornithine cyclodeaminase/alanine dehydrogenase-like protein (mu-crystallin family)
LQQVLRITPEPFTYFDEYQIHHLLTESPAEYLLWVRQKLGDIATGVTQLELPPKQIFHDPQHESDFRVMPCIVRHGGRACKTVKIIGTNTLQQQIPDQITVGKAFALHPEENFISHVFEACLLSSARTGVCAALATELLAPASKSLTIIGAGRVGFYAAFFTAASAGLRSICIADSDDIRAADTAALLSSMLPELTVKAISMQELSDTDVVILATTSSKPFCHPPAWGAKLVISLGADTDSQHELAPEWISIADIFVDTRDSARFGDLAAWQAAGLMTTDNLVDLFDLLRQETPRTTPRPGLFISTGSALFDNLTISYILDKVSGGATSETKSSNL